MRGLHSTDIITDISVTGVGDSVTWGQQNRNCWESFSTLNSAIASLSHSTYLHRTANGIECILKRADIVYQTMPQNSFLRNSKVQ